MSQDEVINMASLPKYVFVIAILVIVGIVYFFRPWMHGLLMFFYRNPMIVMAFIFGFVAFLTSKRSAKMSFFFSAFVVVLLLLQVLSPLLLQLKIVEQTDYTIVDSMYESTQARVVPLSVAKRYGSDSLQKPQERLGDYDPITLNGTQYWISPRVPNGGLLYLLNKVEGMLLVNAQSQERKTQLFDQKFKYGEEIGIFDNIYWHLYKQKYFSDVGEIFYVFDNVSNEMKLVAPIISYKLSFPIMQPYFGGVHVVSANGKIKTYEPSEALEIPFLADTRIYPEYLARLKVESYQFHKGVWNAWFIHEDQIEVADLPGDNSQPFLLDTEDGLKWVIATEPYGDSFGVFKLFFVDAVTGKTSLFELNQDDTLTGPVRVVSFARSQFPLIDWGSSRIVEPRPYIKEGELYWMLSIVPIDFAGISKTIYVNAKTNDVFEGEIYIPVDAPVVQLNSTKEIQIKDKLSQIDTLLTDIRTLIGNNS